jgi:hypothetical protein
MSFWNKGVDFSRSIRIPMSVMELSGTICARTLSMRSAASRGKAESKVATRYFMDQKSRRAKKNRLAPNITAPNAAVVQMAAQSVTGWLVIRLLLIRPMSKMRGSA